MLNLIEPDWPKVKGVKAYSSTRRGGVSLSPYESLNLATHVGDRDEFVIKNRQRVYTAASLPGEPFWLKQTHSTVVVENIGNTDTPSFGVNADGSFSTEKNNVCVVMTADCLPVLMCDQDAHWVAATHAGWRGLAGGILSQTVGCFRGETSRLQAWIGPAIGAKVFEVGNEVYQCFYERFGRDIEPYFKQKNSKFLADLAAIARFELKRLGVNVFGGTLCTYTDSEQFFSYRRDGETGRMASFIWLE